jgi:hypothetical protein
LSKYPEYKENEASIGSNEEIEKQAEAEIEAILEENAA